MLFKNVSFLDKDFVFRTGDIAVENGCFSYHSASGETDCSGLMMFPGLVDIHTHGAAGYDNTDIGFEPIDRISAFMAANGVTTYLPTLITQSRKNMIASAANIANAKKTGTSGAKIGGIYMEGPYFSMKYKGAQNSDYIRDPNISEFSEIFNASNNLIKIVSIAPECSGADNFIREASNMSHIAMGHTDADYDTVMRAAKLGASHLTHTYNAMSGLNHRKPGAVGAAIDSGITCELISDGFHVHPSMVRLLYKAVGKDRLVLISDSVRAAGMPDGEYELGGQNVIMKNGRALLADGTIAGSTATLFGCVKNAVSFGIPVEDAVRAASLNPAKAAGIDKICGIIDYDRPADFLLVDSNLDIKAVYISGVKYSA